MQPAAGIHGELKLRTDEPSAMRAGSERELRGGLTPVGRGIVDLEVSHLALSVARVLFHGAVCWLLLDLWHFRHVAFAPARTGAESLLWLGLFVNGALVLGLFTRPLQIVNPLLLRAIFGLTLDSYTADDVIAYFSLLFAFAPRPRVLALDSWRQGGRPHDPVPKTFSLLVWTGLALIYADGMLYKLPSEVWRNGGAFWMGSALPHFSTGLMPKWAELELPMRACTYAALAYEALFPLIIVRRLRPILTFAGLAVHLGSGILVALPQFALVMAAPVALFARWERVLPKTEPHRQPGPDLPRPSRLAVFAAAALIVLMVGAQLSLHVGAGRGRPPSWLCRVLSIDRRTIFIDWHFQLPGPLLRFAAVDAQGETPIPTFDEEGYPLLHDRYWKLLGFTLRARRDPRQPAALRYVRGWFERTGRPLSPVRVYCKDMRLRSLELDFAADDELRRRPWELCAIIVPAGTHRSALERYSPADRSVTAATPAGF